MFQRSTGVETSKFLIFETLMYHFLFDIHYIVYISAFSIFMCQCVSLMLFLLYKFKILKKWIYFVFFKFCCGLLIFSPMLPRSCIQDTCRIFADAEFFNYDLNWQTTPNRSFPELKLRCEHSSKCLQLLLNNKLPQQTIIKPKVHLRVISQLTPIRLFRKLKQTNAHSFNCFQLPLIRNSSPQTIIKQIPQLGISRNKLTDDQAFAVIEEKWPMFTQNLSNT